MTENACTVSTSCCPGGTYSARLFHPVMHSSLYVIPEGRALEWQSPADRPKESSHKFAQRIRSPRGIIYGEEYREAKTSQNRSETPPNAIKTQGIHTTRKGKSILLFSPLFWTIRYDRYIPLQTLIITLLRNVMLTVLRELGLPVDEEALIDDQFN